MAETSINSKLDIILEKMITKDDLKKLDDKVKSLEAKMATKDELKELNDKMKTLEGKMKKLEIKMATKDELKNLESKMATKDELKNLESKMATKDELKNLESKMATKDELKNLEKKMATKDDLSDLKIDLNNQIEDFRQEVREGFLRVEGQISDLEGSIINKGRDIEKIKADVRQQEKTQDTLTNIVMRVEGNFYKKIKYLEKQAVLNRKEHFEFKEKFLNSQK